MNNLIKSTALATFFLVSGPFAKGIDAFTQAALASPVAVAEAKVGSREGTASLNGFLRLNSKRVRWCAAFVRASYAHAGKRAPATISVAGWDAPSVGPIVTTPQRGDIAFWRHSHVGFVTGYSHGKVCTVSGNRRDAVTKSCEPRNHFRHFRRPTL